MINYNISADYLFSYWIFVWFILFLLFAKSHFVKTNFNPRFALFIALFENIAFFIYYACKNATISVLLKYISMIILFKIIPLFLLRKEKIRWYNEIRIAVVIFIIYHVYLQLNHVDLYEVIQQTSANVLSDANNTPFFRLLHTMSSHSFFSKR